MLYPRIIPSMLLQDGRLVKGKKLSDYVDAGSPATTARAFNAQGADEITLLDIKAWKTGEIDFVTIKKVASECFMPLTVGGGVVNLDLAKKVIDMGADKLSITTSAYIYPKLIDEFANLFGSQATVVGIDFCIRENQFYLFNHRSRQLYTEKETIKWILEVVDRGAGEIRLLSVDREGTRTGYDYSLLRTIRSIVKVPIVIEGGGAGVDGMVEAIRAGASGLSLGSVLTFTDSNIIKIKQLLVNKGVKMRL